MGSERKPGGQKRAVIVGKSAHFAPWYLQFLKRPLNKHGGSRGAWVGEGCKRTLSRTSCEVGGS